MQILSFHSRVNVMKVLLNVLWMALVLFVGGCGGSGSNVDVAGDADAQAVADYEAQIKAQEAAETEAMKAVK